jgi:hypothetical protein
MGLTTTDREKKCYNGAKSWSLGWYNVAPRLGHQQLTSGQKWRGYLVGNDDFWGSNYSPSYRYVVKVYNFYVHFYRAEGFTVDPSGFYWSTTSKYPSTDPNYANQTRYPDVRNKVMVVKQDCVSGCTFGSTVVSEQQNRFGITDSSGKHPYLNLFSFSKQCYDDLFQRELIKLLFQNNSHRTTNFHQFRRNY